MTVRKISRRWMLLGSAGALAIPALPSLLTRRFTSEAKAQEDLPKRMVAVQSDNGAAWQPHMFPDEAMADTPFDHPLHRAHRGEITSRIVDGDRVVSPVLSAPSSVFTESLAAKMNVLRGMDVPFYLGHGRHIVGNYGGLSSPSMETPPDQESADQVLARSTSFYGEPPRRRSMTFTRRGISIELVDPSGPLDGPVRVVEQQDRRTIFDSIYVPNAGEPEPTRAPAIDDAYESFRRLESGAFGAGRRLSGSDRRRLTEYMDRLSDIRLALQSPVRASCADAPVPTEFSPVAEYGVRNYDIINDIIVAAFMCDSSRIAVMHCHSDSWVPEVAAVPEGFHEIAHQAAGNEVMDEALLQHLGGLCRANVNGFFRIPFLDLVTKLDGVSEGEGTMLDQSLVWWSPECGSSTHNADSVPIVSFGSVGGAMQTGQYLDLRNRDVTPDLRSTRFSNEGRRPGACYFQWTTTYLDAFGIPRSDWQRQDRRAFSAMIPQARFMRLRYDQAAMDASCDAPLPLLAG